MGSGHIPVLLKQVTDNLVSEETRLFVDATVGGAGHSVSILDRYPRVALIAFDVDEEVLKIAGERLRPYGERARLMKGNFRHLRDNLTALGIDSCDAILMDLGLSTFQLEGGRGFSFLDEGPLDMRMDPENPVTAYDVVNSYAYEDLKEILREYGEEEKAPRIARAICDARRAKPVATPKELAQVVSKVKWRRGRIHPATKTFQALRIEVNRELESLKKGIEDGVGLLQPGGRLGIISFHSLEDRIVKESFRGDSLLRIITKKPMRAEGEEKRVNPRARSAKLRIAEKVSGGI